MFCCYPPNWNLIKQSKSLQPCQPQHCGQLHDCFYYSFNAGKIMVLVRESWWFLLLKVFFVTTHWLISELCKVDTKNDEEKIKAKRKFICMQIKRMLKLIRVNKRFKVYKHILLVYDVGAYVYCVYSTVGKWLWTFCSSSSSVTETPSVSMRMHNYRKSYVCSWHLHAFPLLVP